MLSKIGNKIILFFVILTVLSVTFSLIKDSINSSGTDGFMEMFEELPFFKPIAGLFVQYMKKETYTFENMIEDSLKLLFMAVLRPLAVSLCCIIFLRIPNFSTVIEREDYMEGLSYKLKSLIVNLFITPLIAIVVAQIVKTILIFCKNKYGEVGFYIVVILLFIFMLFLSLIPLLKGLGLVTALFWRLLITLLSELLNTVIIVLLSIFLVNSVANGSIESIFGVIMVYVIWIIIFEFISDIFRKVIVEAN